MAELITKRYHVFYIYEDHKLDEFIEDGLGWHGDHWWFDCGHNDETMESYLEAENMDAEDMECNLPCLKVSVSFKIINTKLREDLIKLGVTEELCNKAEI